MKRLMGFLLISLFLVAPIAAAEDAAESATMSAQDEKDALHKEVPLGVYGTPPTSAEALPVGEMIKVADENIGNQVCVWGTVSEVCPMRGCWIDLEDASGESMRIKVTDGQIVFPLSAKGYSAIVEGELTKIELSAEEAVAWREHWAYEKGETFDPKKDYGPLTFYQLNGTGAVIVPPEKPSSDESKDGE